MTPDSRLSMLFPDLEPASPPGTDEIVAWNIRHGGGPTRMPEIALELLRLSPHTVCLLEFRPSIGGQIAGVLADHGYVHQRSTQPPPRTNGILIASRSALVEQAPPCVPGRAQVLPYRWLGVRVADLGLTLAAVHAPDKPGRESLLFWRAITLLARTARSEPVALVGDFNADRTRGHRSLGQLASLGFVDAWRAANRRGHEPTWSRNRFVQEEKGRRLDHAWLSPAMADRLRASRHIHRGRLAGLSDHSAIGVSIGPETPSFCGQLRLGSQKTLEK